MYQWVRYTNIFKLPPGVKYLVTDLLSLLFLPQLSSQKTGKKTRLQDRHAVSVFTFQFRNQFKDLQTLVGKTCRRGVSYLPNF